MLRIPDAVKSAMPKGPLARDATLARDLLSDEKQTAVVLVTLPEELPARETSTLARDIRELRMPLGPLVVNAMPPAAATDPALDKVLAANANTPPPPELAGILAGVNVLAARRRDAERIVTGLASDPGLPMLQLPRLPSNDLGPEEIAHLADLLATALSIQT
jgi:anion-transporting  ArsA/GET3 family ATPase